MHRPGDPIASHPAFTVLEKEFFEANARLRAETSAQWDLSGWLCKEHRDLLSNANLRGRNHRDNIAGVWFELVQEAAALGEGWEEYVDRHLAQRLEASARVPKDPYINVEEYERRKGGQPEAALRAPGAFQYAPVFDVIASDPSLRPAASSIAFDLLVGVEQGSIQTTYRYTHRVTGNRQDSKDRPATQAHLETVNYVDWVAAGRPEMPRADVPLASIAAVPQASISSLVRTTVGRNAFLEAEVAYYDERVRALQPTAAMAHIVQDAIAIVETMPDRRARVADFAIHKTVV